MGRFAWGVGVAAASGGLPKRFLDENWFWSYDWKVPEVFLVFRKVLVRLDHLQNDRDQVVSWLVCR